MHQSLQVHSAVAQGDSGCLPLLDARRWMSCLDEVTALLQCGVREHGNG